MIRGFFRKSIWLGRLQSFRPSEDLSLNFSTIRPCIFKKFTNKSAQESLIFSTQVISKKCLVLVLILVCFIQQLCPASSFQAAQEEKYKISTPSKARLLLVTGCSRSGTTYISEVLRLCGLDILHERLGHDGISSWPMAVNSDYSPWGPPAKGISFKHTFHQVRHPLLVISSVFTTEKPKSWNFIKSQIPQIKESDAYIVQCAKYWFYWNLAAEKKAEWTYRIEELENVFDEMSQRLGLTLNRAALYSVPRDCNHRADYVHKFTWEDLRQSLPEKLFIDIQNMALRYGYTIDEL